MNEEREREEASLRGLGDLDEEHKRERGEAAQAPGSIVSGEQYVKAEMSRAADVAPVLPGPPPLLQVQSVYDTRPINGRDFFITLEREVAAPGTNIVSWTVPNNYVAVLRGFEFFIDPLPGAGGKLDYITQLTLNGAGVGLFTDPSSGTLRDYAQIATGPVLDTLLPCHLIAGSGESIGLTLVIGVALVGAFAWNVQFYGQFLPITGVPKNFQVGSPPPVYTLPPLPAS